MEPTRLAQLSDAAWLLENEDPGVRYLALRDLAGLGEDTSDLRAAGGLAHTAGPIATVLQAMHPEGYWVQPGPGYNPKYRSTVWSLILLAQLGARLDFDARISTACGYFLDQALTRHGQLSANGAPSGTVDCLQGNLCWALLRLGCRDPRLEQAFDWLARSNTGEGVAPLTERLVDPRYYASGKSGPGFACAANNRQSCAWGAVKCVLALGALPAAWHTPLTRQALALGAEFLLAGEPGAAGYPNGYSEKPSGSWFKFGFPVFYVTDVLQIVEALAQAGYGQDPRLAPAVELILSKQVSPGRWTLEYDYHDKTWLDFGPKKQPNAWVSLRALRALHRLEHPAVIV